jgi:Glycosyl hydrolase-like 10
MRKQATSMSNKRLVHRALAVKFRQGNQMLPKMRIKILTAVATTCLSCSSFLVTTPAKAAGGPYCQFTPEEAATKEKLLTASLKDDQGKVEYEAMVQKHREMLQICRSQTWPEEQAVWLRLYPCDIKPGSMDYVLDRIVNLGYNRIHLEVFYDSQVLLPPGDNPTPWTPVVQSPNGDQIDLLQQAIDKAHQRGLKVYAWMFTMNFGYTYAQRPDRQEALARNAKGQNSLSYVHDLAQAFVDPYSPQAQTDYANLVQAVLKRKPDGILFDYVRYPRGVAGHSSVHSVKDLWIHGKSSLNALYSRATNSKGLALIKKFVETGNLSANDIKIVDQQYPKETQAKWQGSPSESDSKASASSRQNQLNQDLWFFSVAHAAQGVIDFLSLAAQPVQDRGLKAGAVFFPDANRRVSGQGFDSRLQAWDQFPTDLEWHPMAYAVCEEKTNCITDEVTKVLKTSPETTVIPAIAGAWGKEYRDHLPLETQIEALRKATPEVNSISHFSYAWLEPDLDRRRQSCKLF